MKKFFRVFFPALLAVLLSAVNAHATDVYLGEEWLFKISGSKVKIIGGDVYNNSDSASGTLEVQLWATPKRYSGKSQRGYKLGSGRLSPLPAKSYYTNVVKSSKYKKPARGSWYVTIILCEWDGYKWIARSWLGWGKKKF